MDTGYHTHLKAAQHPCRHSTDPPHPSKPMDIDKDPPARPRPRTRDVSKTTTYIIDHQHAKVRGTVLRLADSGERIAVACPFCHRVHLHEPTRHLVSTFVPPGVDPEAEALAYDESTGYAGDVKARPLNVVTWETDRVALCKMGTYHIVGD